MMTNTRVNVNHLGCFTLIFGRFVYDAFVKQAVSETTMDQQCCKYMYKCVFECCNLIQKMRA